MRRRHLTLVLGAGALLVGVLPTQIARAGGGGTPEYVSPTGSDSGNCQTKTLPCLTVSYAVTQASSGNVIHLAAGTYTEQVEIQTSLSIVGAGENKSKIAAPASLVTNAQLEPQTYIVDISNGASVSLSNLTVTGPGPSQAGGADCNTTDSDVLDMGIDVWGGGTLNMKNAAVKDIYLNPINGCQTGEAISIGQPCFTCTDDTGDFGSATLSNVVVSLFQKDGVTVRGAGSSLVIKNSQVVNLPSAVIASNGIEVLNGAKGKIVATTVTGNECNLASTCGPDLVNQSQGSGILVIAAGLPTTVTTSTVVGNDAGLYDDTGITATASIFDGNRYVGVQEDVDAADGHYLNDTADSEVSGADQYGFYTVSPSTNQFENDTATGNSAYDMYENTATHDNNTYTANVCNTAYTSTAHWDCT